MSTAELRHPLMTHRRERVSDAGSRIWWWCSLEPAERLDVEFEPLRRGTRSRAKVAHNGRCELAGGGSLASAAANGSYEANRAAES
jgi:hypothetical protein